MKVSRLTGEKLAGVISKRITYEKSIEKRNLIFSYYFYFLIKILSTSIELIRLSISNLKFSFVLSVSLITFVRWFEAMKEMKTN